MCRSAQSRDKVGGEHREGQQHQEGGDELVPGEYRHPEHDHPRRPQAEHGGDQVDAGEHARRIAARATPTIQRSPPGPGEWIALGQRRIGEPAPLGGPDEVRKPESSDAPTQEEPVGKGIEPGEGHVGRADLHGHQIVGRSRRRTARGTGTS